MCKVGKSLEKKVSIWQILEKYFDSWIFQLWKKIRQINILKHCDFFFCECPTYNNWWFGNSCDFTNFSKGNFYCISKTLSIFMGGENVGFLKIGMSPTLNLFAQNVSLVRVRVKTTKWLTWWTNFNGREQGKKMWMKLVKLHIQIPNFSCTDFSPSIIWSNPLLWFFFGCTWMILRSHTFAPYANFWCAKIQKRKLYFFYWQNQRLKS